MKSFAIREKKTAKGYYGIRASSILFGVLVVVVFTVVSFFAKITSWVQYENKIDLFEQNISDIAFYFWTIDQNVAQMLLGIDELSKAYLSGENILKTKSDQLDDLIYYIQQNRSYLQHLGFKKYAYLVDMLSDFWSESAEIKQLLGVDSPQNYLVILQNTNERRPNGGFFGSFAFVTLDKARITNLEIIDSYYPDYFAPTARIPLTSRQKKLFPLAKGEIGFIAGNKFGFTDMDGKNLKTLYEMSFNTHYDKKKLDKLINPGVYTKLLHKNIKGVVFVRLDLFTKYFPQLEEISWEWQFVNANIDLIRGEVKKDKKEKYIKEANLFFHDNWKALFRAVVNNLEDIIQQRGVNIYLSNVSQHTQDTLEKHHLTTLFSTGNIYFWDTNVANNKSDMFVQKTVEVYDDAGELVRETERDIIAIHGLPSGKYHVKIYYSFTIPPAYIRYIRALEEEYGIVMTEREQSILGLAPSMYLSTDGVPRYRGTKSYVYFPQHVRLENFSEWSSASGLIQVPFATVYTYNIFITNKHQTKILEMDMIIS